MCMDLMSQLLTGAIYIPMKLSHCSLESGKARPEQMASHLKEMVEGCIKRTVGDDEFRGCGVEGMRCGLRTGAISGIACQNMAHYLLSTGQ